MSGDLLAASSPGIRTSDAERERVVRKLQREFAAGLTIAELEKRIAAAQSAPTREKLSTLTADLGLNSVPAHSAAALDRQP